ncbi:MAG: M81 family metallopeptidase [Deltaproteobacteria bacterium]|nr:M81 family metallopeptidase [Deltaproteobacteria bacterium]
MRLAFGRINQETNALSPVVTTLDDFKATHFVDGADLLAGCDRFGQELKSMFKNAELSGFVQQAKKKSVDVVPLLSAWAVPAGPLTRACFDTLVDGLCAKLKAAGDLDGVYLALHGAMNVRDLPLSDDETPESEILRRVRVVVGDAMPIAVSLDLHGNLCRKLLERSTIIQAYQTNPHRDHAAVGARCARLLIGTVQGRIKPVMAWRSLPMILGGGNTIDFLPPLRGIFSQMKTLEKDPRVLGTSLLSVHPWNNHKELGWSTLVVTDALQDPKGAFADDAADTLARRAWDVRHELPPVFKTPDEAIARARRGGLLGLLRKTGITVFSDASDVVSAGSPGENTLLLEKLIEATDLVSHATLRDPELVDALWKANKQGDVVDVTLGCKLDPTRGKRLQVKGRIERLASAHGLGRFAILLINNMHLVVVEGPALAMRPAYYKAAGLDPWKADVVVVKNFFPFLLFFAPLMRDVVFVRTAGVTDFDASFALTFTDPVHPRDRVEDWRKTDERRRSLMPPAQTTTSTPAAHHGLA